MEVGVSLNMLQQEGRSDASVLRNHLAIGDLAEKCLPTLKNDPSFCVPIIPAGEIDSTPEKHEDVFAPA